MKPGRALSRRSFVAAVAGASGALALLGGPAAAQITDSDPGDARGRGTVTGLYDRDPADPAGRGTLSGRTDRDPADPPRRGRATRAPITDGDKNRLQDATGSSGCADQDSGPASDPLGRPRGRCVWRSHRH
jgi:hypothetical protein